MQGLERSQTPHAGYMGQLHVFCSTAVFAPAAYGCPWPVLPRPNIHLFDVLGLCGFVEDLCRGDECDVAASAVADEIVFRVVGKVERHGAEAAAATAGLGELPVSALDGPCSAEAFWLLGPEYGEGVDAVVFWWRLVGEDHYSTG